MMQLLVRARFVPMPAWAIPHVEPGRIFIAEIQRAVARHYGLTVRDLLSAKRAKHVARPRQVAMYLARRLTDQSLPAIAKRFGDRDHSTACWAVDITEARRRADPALDADIRALEAELRG